MEVSENLKGPADALSPSRITDYFNSSKIRTRGACRHKKTKEHPVFKTTLYLTPESSPDNDFGSDFSRESDEATSNKIVGQDKDYCCNTDSFNIDFPKKVTTSEFLTSALPYVEDSSKATVSPLSSTYPNSFNSNAESILLCEASKVGTENAEVILPVSEDSQCKHAESVDPKSRHPATVAASNDAVITSPSFPRPKLRKGSKSKSKTDALVTAASEPVKQKPGRRKKKEPEPVQKNVITDFFPIRRSGRVTKSEIEREKQHQLEQQTLSKCEDGLQITEFENKGRGVVATKEFLKGDFVVEYDGELIDAVSAKHREKDYATDPQIGCYMYFFTVGAKHYCVDATAESGRLGRLINHSRDGNCCTKAVIVKGKPHLIFVASRNIKSGEELCYDYGDRSRAALEAHPWLKS